MLSELIGRLRSGELTLGDFARAAAGEFQFAKTFAYPHHELDSGFDTVGEGTLQNAVMDGELSQDEADAVYAALPPKRP